MGSPVTANKIRGDIESLDRQIVAASQAAVDAAENAAVEHQAPELVAAAELAQIEIEGLQRRRAVLQAALDPISRRDAERAMRLANENRRLARGRLEKDLRALHDAAFAYSVHSAKLVGMYNRLTEAAAAVRGHFDQKELRANGQAIDRAYSAGNMLRLANMDLYRDGNGSGPGTRRDEVPIDLRDNAAAIPAITETLAKVAEYALKMFDGPEPAAKPKPYIVPTAPAGALNASYTQHGQQL